MGFQQRVSASEGGSGRSRLQRRLQIVGGLALLLAAGAGLARSAAEFEQRAEALAAAGDKRGAIIELRNALQKDKRRWPAWIRLGELYLEIGDVPAARSALLRGKEQGAPPPELLLPLARTYELLADLESLLALEPPADQDFFTQAELLTIQGRALLQAGRLDEANQRLQAAERLDPTSVPLLQTLASLSMARNSYGTAAKHLRRAKRIAPDSAENWYLGGDLAFKGEKILGYRDICGRTSERGYRPDGFAGLIDPDTGKYHASHDDGYGGQNESVVFTRVACSK